MTDKEGGVYSKTGVCGCIAVISLNNPAYAHTHPKSKCMIIIVIA